MRGAAVKYLPCNYIINVDEIKSKYVRSLYILGSKKHEGCQQ